MFTVHFQVPQLRPDLARFATQDEAQSAANILVNRMHVGRPIRVTIRHRGATVFSYERK